ncbi:hypothetical protein F5H01DRAFT_350514 [Linnemannia elongata]|nr:hypothetical protein F5H01DRAFT_350514 [Linnemannia elongata]
MRSATIDVTEPYHSNSAGASSPRTALDLPGEVRVRPRADSVAAPTIYNYPPGSRSHASLGDEVLQRNYTYANNHPNNGGSSNPTGNPHPVLNALDDDPMRPNSEHSQQRPIVESPEEMFTRTLHVPGGCGIEVSDYGFGASLNSTTTNTTTTSTASAPDSAPGNSNNSTTLNATSTTTTTSHSWLFNRKHNNNNNSNNDSSSNSNGNSNGNNNNNSTASTINGSLSPPSTIHQRRGSLDPSITLSYSTGTSMGLNPSSAQQQFPNIEAVRTMEEHYSHYGVTEYQPAGLEGNKAVSKEKKTLKDKLKNWEKERQERQQLLQQQQQQQQQSQMDGDRASVHSRDSGDTGSSYTANMNGQWDGSNQPPSIYGYSNNTGSSINANSVMSDNSHHKEKFSLGKMLKGFRKKHTKGAHSGGSSYLHPNYSSNGIGRFLHGEDDLLQQHPLDGEGGGPNGFMVNGEDMDDYGDGGQGGSIHRGMGPSGSLYHGGLDLEDARAPTSSSPNALLSAYQPQFRQKFESSPNLSSLASYSNPEPAPQPQPRSDEVPLSDRERVMPGFGGGGITPASSTTATLVSESMGLMLGAGGFGGRSRSSSIQGPSMINPNRLSINSVRTVNSLNSVNSNGASSPLHGGSSPSPGTGSRPTSLRQFIPEHQPIVQQPDSTTQCHVEPQFMNNGVAMNIHSVS